MTSQPLQEAAAAFRNKATRIQMQQRSFWYGLGSLSVLSLAVSGSLWLRVQGIRLPSVLAPVTPLISLYLAGAGVRCANQAESLLAQEK